MELHIETIANGFVLEVDGATPEKPTARFKPLLVSTNPAEVGEKVEELLREYQIKREDERAREERR